MSKRKDSGSVSIFAVIFAALLLTIVTVGFIKLMLDDQNRAASNDLSQSAYDAALSGVEDAKRVVIKCNSGDSQACNAIEAQKCQTVQKSGIFPGSPDDKEVKIKTTSTSTEQYDQAYTCVKVDMDTDDYMYKARNGITETIPLRSANNSEFNTILLEWLTKDDTGGVAELPANSLIQGDNLPPENNWRGQKNPALMRAHIITPGSESVTPNGLDDSKSSSTLFLKPTSVNGSGTAPVSVALATPRTQEDKPGGGDNYATGIACSKNLNLNQYSCRVKIKLDQLHGAGQNSLLRLTPIYGGNVFTVRVSLMNGDQPVKFSGIQPSVDSTGRAGNVFRRVDARLQLVGDFAYPEGAVGVNEALCKDFNVDDQGYHGTDNGC